MGRLSQYSEQYKLAVVEHYQNTSDGYKLTAKHFGLDHATVRTWVKVYQQHGLPGLRPTHGYYSQSFKLTVGSAVASDAFFPFADGVEALAAAGARAVIQPGGSMRDAEVIAAADRLGLAMVFTGQRHFRH